MPPRPCRQISGGPSPASQKAMSWPAVSIRPKRRRPGSSEPAVDARKPIPRWRFSRTLRRPRRNACIPPATSSAIDSQVLVDAERRASGVPDGGARCIVGISMTASQSRPSVTSSRILAEPPGTSISPGSKRETSSSRASIAVADGSAVAVPIPSKIPLRGALKPAECRAGGSRRPSRARSATRRRGPRRRTDRPPGTPRRPRSRRAPPSKTNRAPLGGSPVAPAIASAALVGETADQRQVAVAVRLAALEHAVDVLVGEKAYGGSGHRPDSARSRPRLPGGRRYPTPQTSMRPAARPVHGIGRSSSGTSTATGPCALRSPTGTEATSA